MEIEQPLISVVTPCYNSPDLWTTIDSVLMQTYAPLEYIIIDDGSDNFSVAEVTAYLQKYRRGNLRRFSVLKNKENKGTVRTMNRGIQAARGEYIFQLAGDDAFADPKVLADWVVAFCRTGALAMTGRRENYDARLEHLLSIGPSDKQVKMLQTLSPQALFERMGAVNFIFGCCTAYRRTCLERYGLYDTSYRLIEDHSMNLRLLRQGVAITFFDRVVVKYRSGGASSGGKYNLIYERDTDKIFANEILPYTVNPGKVTKQYKKWKQAQRLERHFYELRQKYHDNLTALFFVRVWYYIHHPLRVLRRILH